MAKVSISEAARLAGKSRTTLHRLIKTGELSVSAGDRNAKMIDVSELLRVFPDLSLNAGEHLKTLVSSQQSHIESLKQAMLLIGHKQQS